MRVGFGSEYYVFDLLRFNRMDRPTILFVAAPKKFNGTLLHPVIDFYRVEPAVLSATEDWDLIFSFVLLRHGRH
jgi:hypothetical protein